MTDKVRTTVGEVEINGAGGELQADIPHEWIASDDPQAPRVKVGVTLGRSVNYGDHSYRVHIGLDVPASTEQALSGEMHMAVYDFVEKLAAEAVLVLEDTWIPPGFQSMSPILLTPEEEKKS